MPELSPVSRHVYPGFASLTPGTQAFPLPHSTSSLCVHAAYNIDIHHTVATAETTAEEHQRVLCSGKDGRISRSVAMIYTAHFSMYGLDDLTRTPVERDGIRHVAAEASTECKLNSYKNRTGATVTEHLKIRPAPLDMLQIRNAPPSVQMYPTIRAPFTAEYCRVVLRGYRSPKPDPAVVEIRPLRQLSFIYFRRLEAKFSPHTWPAGFDSTGL